MGIRPRGQNPVVCLISCPLNDNCNTIELTLYDHSIVKVIESKESKKIFVVKNSCPDAQGDTRHDR